jgi:hypothetical protein
MYLSVFTEPAAFDLPPQLDVQLDRTTARDGHLTGEQDHIYGYAPLTGLTLTTDPDLLRAHVRSRTSIDPSAIDMRFRTLGSSEQLACSLTFQVASGSLSATTFKIATGTVPFFGNITTPPATATVVHDPGCGSLISSSSSSAAAAAVSRARVLPATARAAIFREPCTGPTLAHSTFTTYWLSQLGVHRHRLAQLGQTTTNPFGPDGTTHVAIGLGPGADMGRIVHTAHGVHEAVRTKGMPFMGGSAVFRATAEPHVSPGHSCTWERHTYHYTNVRYQGALTPAGSPLAIMFDTGAEKLGTAHATLWVPQYRRMS